MEKIQALIADDEEQLRTYLKNKLKLIWPELVICAEAENGIAAIELTEKLRPDIAFLDIKMPGKSGIEAAGEINRISRIVFITAYDQYAVDAFENEAIDYILKPYEEKRLKKCVARLKKRILAEKNNGFESRDISLILRKIADNIPAQPRKKYLQWIRVQKQETIHLIPVNEISLFMAQDKYTALFSRKKEYLIRRSIKELEQQLEPELFWRIHRSTIVRVGDIEKVSRSITGRYVIKVKNFHKPVTVSRRYTHLFKQM